MSVNDTEPVKPMHDNMMVIELIRVPALEENLIDLRVQFSLSTGNVILEGVYKTKISTHSEFSLVFFSHEQGHERSIELT